MARTPEGKIKDKVTAMLKKHGVFYFLPGNNGFGTSGIPDYVCCVDGQFIGIECKAGKGKQATPLQMKAGAAIVAAGGRWFLVYDDETIAGVESVIVAYKKDTYR
jgi:hypothetical protein